MFARIKALTFKIKVVVYALIIVIVALIAFGIYVKVRGVQSVDFIEHQAASTSDMSVLMDEAVRSLRGIEGELSDLRKETCLLRAGENVDMQADC